MTRTNKNDRIQNLTNPLPIKRNEERRKKRCTYPESERGKKRTEQQLERNQKKKTCFCFLQKKLAPLLRVSQMTSSRYPTRNINTTKKMKKGRIQKEYKKRHLTKTLPELFIKVFFFFLISMFLCLIPDSLICPSPCLVAANPIPIRWEVLVAADVLGCRRGLVYSISLIYDFFLSAVSSLSPSLFEASLYMPLDLAAGGTGLRDFVWGSIGQPLQSFL